MSTGDFFELSTHSAQRLETLPFYGPDTEAFQTFQEGRSPTPEQQARRQQWRDSITTAAQGGRRVGRILVVTSPLVSYWRWRLDMAVGNVAAGEDIRIADRTEHPELAQLTTDWWGFDFETDRPFVQLMEYAPDGAYVGREEIRNPVVIARCRAELDLAMRYAVPLKGFAQATT